MLNGDKQGILGCSNQTTHRLGSFQRGLGCPRRTSKARLDAQRGQPRYLRLLKSDNPYIGERSAGAWLSETDKQGRVGCSTGTTKVS